MFPKKIRKNGGMLYYNVLVIEDQPEFVEVAKSALKRLSGWDFFFVSSYEEALESLEQGYSYPRQEGARVRKNAESASFKIDAVISDLFFPSQVDWRDELLLKLEKTGEEGRPPRGVVTENPSGLAIARWCHEHEIPFVMISQGDRHEGNLDLVRAHLYGTSFVGIRHDPLMNLLVRQGSQVDKRNPYIWLEAMVSLVQGGAATSLATES